MSRCLLDFRLM
ncbi:hypothetical protein LINPERHAP2_LOCUS14213 [Linum perenne]